MGSEHTSILKLAMAKATALGWRVFQNVVGNAWTGRLDNSWTDAKAGRCVEISGANFQPFGLLVPSIEGVKKNAKGEKIKKKYGGGFDAIGWECVRIMPAEVPPDGLRIARFVAIDAKTDADSLSADQRHFAAQVVKAGGRAFVARRLGEHDAELIPVGEA